MKIFISGIALCAILRLTHSEEIRLINLDPPEAQQYIDRQDTSLKYAPKIASSVPAVRFLGNEPHNVNEDIYLANQYHGQDGLGGYLYGYGVPDIAKTERKQAGGDLRGAYNYIAGNGQEIKVEYWDDGTGFHQIDNVPKIQPQQIDDTPEVKAAKEEHARIWHEEAERNSKPIQNPYDNHANFAPQGQAQQLLVNQYQQQKQQFPNPGQNVHYQGSQNPAGFGGQSQASQSNSQYANVPSGSGNQGAGYRPTSASAQFGSNQAGGQYGAGQASGSGHYGAGQSSSQSGAGLASGSGQHGAGQNTGQYGGRQVTGSGQFGAGSSSGSGQYGTGQSPSQYGTGQAPGGGQFGAGQTSGSGQYGAGQGSGQFGAGQSSGNGKFSSTQASGNPYGGTGISGGQSSASGQYSGSQSYGSQSSASNQYSQSYSGKNEGEYNENQEEQGPPKGFFYSFDYPVGIIVSKGGPANLKDLYSKNKDNFEKQLQQGHLSGSSSSTGYLAA